MWMHARTLEFIVVIATTLLSNLNRLCESIVSVQHISDAISVISAIEQTAFD